MSKFVDEYKISRSRLDRVLVFNILMMHYSDFLQYIFSRQVYDYCALNKMLDWGLSLYVW